MWNVLYVALGGAFGSVMRYGLGLMVAHLKWSFPLATLLCNVLGSLLLGFVAAMVVKGLPDGWRLFITVGLCGGFTTFSTFSMDAVRMMQEGSWSMLVVYMFVTLMAGFGALYIGLKL